MTQAVYERTPNLGLGLIEFSFPNWAEDANLNMTIIDAAMRVVGVSIKGTWNNSTTYQPGDLVVDSDLNSLWRAKLAHTSSATGTFAAERTAHPTYWDDASSAIHARGQWTPSTTYYVNDITYDGYTWGLVTNQYTSGASFSADVAAGDIVVIFDGTATVDDSEAAATVAMNSATAAAASATTATAQATLATNASNAASASAASAATSATNSSNSATAAAASATQANNLYNAMLPDAPNDGKFYARRNVTWQAAVGEAPNDGLVYTRKNAAWVASGSVIVSDSPPSPVANGQLWFESDSGNTFMWYVDADSSQWIHMSGFSMLIPGGGGGIAEAPSDGHTYARRDTAWIDMGGAVPVNEAPNDGKQYVRKNQAWVEVVFPTVVATPFLYDVNGDAIIKIGSTIVVRVKPSGLILTKDDVEVFSTSV